MTPFQLETQLATKIETLPKDTSINGAMLVVETIDANGDIKRAIVIVGSIDVVKANVVISKMIFEVAGIEQDICDDLSPENLHKLGDVAAKINAIRP